MVAVSHTFQSFKNSTDWGLPTSHCTVKTTERSCIKQEVSSRVEMLSEVIKSNELSFY